jgi:1,4-dihydroxy-2-naphthoate octaprenyltransferase
MRLPFLPLSFFCVALGISAAKAWNFANLLWILFAFIGGLSAHLAVNLHNEWDDHRTGLDAALTRTPISGGSGALEKCPQAAKLVHLAAWFFVAVCLISGGILAWHAGTWTGLGLLALGIICILTYARFGVKSPLAGLLLPGLGFGPSMCLGTSLALQGDDPLLMILSMTVPFLLASMLLLLGQIPDAAVDVRFGRRSFVIVYGLSWTRRVVGILLALSAATPFIAWIVGVYPVSVLLVIPLILLGYFSLPFIRESGPRLLYGLLLLAAICVLVPGLLALVLALAGSATR